MSSSGPDVTVIIPAFREAERIGATVAASHGLSGVRTVIVVDDGSDDNTAQVAERTGAIVVRLERNGGKARALEAGGARAVADNGTALLLLLDADLGATAAEAACLISPVATGNADMTIATFPVIPGRGGGMGLVVRLARWGIRRATGNPQQFRAPLSGQRCLTPSAWKAVTPLAPGFGVETGMTIDALRAGLTIVEVETRMDHRVTGSDWRARRHRARQLRDVARAILPRLLFRASRSKAG